MTESTATLLIDTTYRVGNDDVEAFTSLARQMAGDARRREGCLFLKVAQDIDDPTTFHLFENWRDRDAFDAHMASDEMHGVLREAAELEIVERCADAYVVSGRTALELPS